MNTRDVFDSFTGSPSQQDSGGCETQAVAKITSQFINFLFHKHLVVHTILKSTVTAVVSHNCKCTTSQRENIVGFLEKGSVHVLQYIQCQDTQHLMIFSSYDALQISAATSYSTVFPVSS